jgi:hypothetical protein
MTDYAEFLYLDFEQRDNIQDVTLTKVVTDETVEEVKAFTRSLNFREVSLGVSLGFEATDQVMELSARKLADAVPESGDRITDANGTEWTIVSLGLSDFSGTPVSYTAVIREVR